MPHRGCHLFRCGPSGVSEKAPTRFGKGTSLLGLLATGGLAFFATTRPWWSTTVTTAGMPRTDVEAIGSAALPWAIGLSLLLMASALGIIAGSVVIRRIVGTIAVSAGIAGVIGVVTVSGNPAQQTALDVTAVSGATVVWVDTWWRAVASGGFAGATLVGVWVAFRSHTWAEMSARFEAPTNAGELDEVDTWKLLDAGIDPTQASAE
ncbi:MAG: hypothetical protein E6Q27_00695 [Aeromicrobium sp.]|nr:MAG: hypothetical protein E6Q27_00695 [Aeromicrobium sp.]